MKNRIFYDGPQRTMSQSEYEAQIDKPCFFCGADHMLKFFLEDIRKVVCFDCVGTKEVEEFEKMVKRNAKKK